MQGGRLKQEKYKQAALQGDLEKESKELNGKLVSRVVREAFQKSDQVVSDRS